MTADDKVENVLNWQKLIGVLTLLKPGDSAQWQSFEFPKPNPDGSFPPRATISERKPASVVVLEGAYSSHSRLRSILDLTVLVQLPVAERRRRLIARDGEDYQRRWQECWGEAEDAYFSGTSHYDLVVTG